MSDIISTCSHYKFIKDMFYIFFNTKPSKSGWGVGCFILKAYLSLDHSASVQ